MTRTIESQLVTFEMGTVAQIVTKEKVDSGSVFDS
jgi:hypothetical protein